MATAPIAPPASEHLVLQPRRAALHLGDEVVGGRAYRARAQPLTTPHASQPVPFDHGEQPLAAIGLARHQDGRARRAGSARALLAAATSGMRAPGTRRGSQRALTYPALRRVMQRANDGLGTNWDGARPAAHRGGADGRQRRVDVAGGPGSLLGHADLRTTSRYTVPRADELCERLQEFYAPARPRRHGGSPPPTPPRTWRWCSVSRTLGPTTSRTPRVSQFLLIMFRRRPRLRGRPGFSCGVACSGRVIAARFRGPCPEQAARPEPSRPRYARRRALGRRLPINS